MDLTTVIINYQTPELLETAVTSFKKHYPNVELLIIDNGSKDNSPELIQSFKNTFQNIETVFLDTNIYHGPAMDLAVREYVQSEFVFFLDSDTETKEGGFLENCLDILHKEEETYGMGEILRVNKKGFKDESGFPILSTPYMVLKREVYLSLPPFVHHGQPTIYNFKMALEKGFKLKHFPMTDFIFHHWRGTANKFGYGLGWRSKVDYLLNKMGF